MTADREPQDVEARLRASLRAYADAVDEAPPAVCTGAVTHEGSLGRRWRAPALVAAVVLAVAGGAWVVVDAPSASSPTAAPASTSADRGAEAATQPSDEAGAAAAQEDELAAAATGPAGQLVVPPPAQIGVAYPFDLYTHCGILGTDVAGVWFAADPPLVDEFGPPAGWDDPYQRGTLRLATADEAVFRDDAGHEISLRAADSERPPPCA